jgi:hypothetical protein
MTKHLLTSLRQSLFRATAKSKPRKPHRGRKLALETLEHRQMLSITPLANLSSSQDTGEKPQSKVFEYAGQWWTVMPISSGTWVHRLDGTSWTPAQQITTNKSVHADVKLVGDVAHVLLFNGNSSQLASLKYDAADNRFEPWSLRPQVVNLPLGSSVETATIEADSTGRLWVAYDRSSTVEVRYSDGNYSTWSAPITVASGIGSDDISAIVAMPNNKIGVMWSNQSTDRFGFKVHQDGAAPNAWSTDELPASQSALGVGGGMADDHLHLATTSDGTVYAAVKTSYDKSGYAKIALLVRRPNGRWDNLYQVDTSGTRPIVVVNEAAGKLIVAYTAGDHASNIVYKESPLGTIAFGARQVLMSGSLNNVTSTKSTSTDEIVFLASGRGALFSFDAAPAPVNQAPVVSAGPDRSIQFGASASLNGTVTDDGRPSPGALSVSWTRFSGPGSGIVTFGNSSAVDTSASFSMAGTYVLRLTANDGQRITSDDMTVIVAAAPTNNPPPPNNTTPSQIAFQDGLFPYVSYAGTTDTKISSGKPTTNYGSATTFDLDSSPDIAALLRWDISAIPTGSIVVSAAIELNVTNSSKHNYEVYALHRAWDELSATWQQFASGRAWTGGGASGSGDHGTAVLGQLAPTSNGIFRIALNDAGLSAVQAWINNPTSNFGIILKDFTASDGVDFSSSKTATASQRPKLVVNYNTPNA